MQLTGNGLFFVLNRAGVRRAVKLYRFVFGNEYSRCAACS